MGNEDYGESSRRHENNDDERPLKKARYVWEVKGKYHLKASYQNPVNVDEPKPISKEDKVDGNENIYVDHNINNNLVLNNNNESCTNRCCIESFLAKTDVLMDSDDDETAANLERSVCNEIPITLVSPNPKNQDYYLRKWQARQMARGFMDNTINIVLENWMGSPFDATDLVENCDNDGHVEDKGILMAIQSHGLQSNIDGNVLYQNTNDGNNSNKKESSVSFVRPQAIVESTFDNFENVHNELIKSVMSSSSSSSSSSSNDSMSCDSSNNQNLESDINLDMNNPVDFLNAAVSVAIQKKGLSSYSY